MGGMLHGPFIEMAKAVIEGDEERTVSLAKEALSRGSIPPKRLKRVLQRG